MTLDVLVIRTDPLSTMSVCVRAWSVRLATLCVVKVALSRRQLEQLGETIDCVSKSRAGKVKGSPLKDHRPPFPSHMPPLIQFMSRGPRPGRADWYLFRGQLGLWRVRGIDYSHA